MERRRICYLDNLKVLLICLVIAVHASVTYGGVGSWYYKEAQSGVAAFVVLTFFNAVCQSFFMGLLFLIAGVFTPASYDRKGPKRFLADRFLRLGVPIVIYTALIQPAMLYPLHATGNTEFEGTYGQLLPAYYKSLPIVTGPLWFLGLLLIFAVMYTLSRMVTARRSPAETKLIAPPSGLQIILLALCVGVVTCVARIWWPIGRAFGPLNLQLGFSPQYICMFCVGIVAFRHNWLERIPVRMIRTFIRAALALALIGFPAIFVVGGALEGNVEAFIGGFHWQAFAYALWEQCMGLTMMVLLLVVFRETANRHNRLTKAMSFGCYGAYIVHAPVVVAMSLAIRNVPIHPLVKFALVTSVAIALSFGIGHGLRRLPLARRVL